MVVLSVSAVVAKNSQKMVVVVRNFPFHYPLNLTTFDVDLSVLPPLPGSICSGPAPWVYYLAGGPNFLIFLWWVWVWVMTREIVLLI